MLHLDPFAFVMAQDHTATRALYRDIVRECDTLVSDGRLAAASLFFTWGSNGAAAKEDLHGGGYLGGRPGGYRNLLSHVNPAQRIVIRWCWELLFSLLVIVPSRLRTACARAIETDLGWLIRAFGTQLLCEQVIGRALRRQAMTPAFVGLGVGLLASVAIGRVIESMLFGVSPRDLVTYATVVTMVLAGALAACLFPARRAALVDPAMALRPE